MSGLLPLIVSVPRITVENVYGVNIIIVKQINNFLLITVTVAYNYLHGVIQNRFPVINGIILHRSDINYPV